jgi:hypothetical protein
MIGTAPYAALLLRMSLGVMFRTAAAEVQALLVDGKYSLASVVGAKPALRAA